MGMGGDSHSELLVMQCSHEVNNQSFSHKRYKKVILYINYGMQNIHSFGSDGCGFDFHQGNKYTR